MLSNNEILNLVDLTSLNPTDTNDNIVELLNKVNNNKLNVAALCIYKEFLPLLANKLHNNNIKLATVINFSLGDNTLLSTLHELENSITNGANEIDLVMPYKQLLANNITFTENYIKQVRKNCNVTLKIIIESGELKTNQNIELASKMCIVNGADFIKTSTGKVSVNATLQAAEIMLNQIKIHNPKCGFKAAGGVKTKDQALQYTNLATSILGADYVNNSTFRFGASGLLDNLLNNTNSTASY